MEKKSAASNAVEDLSSKNFTTIGEALPCASGFTFDCARSDILTMAGFGVLAHPAMKRRMTIEIHRMACGMSFIIFLPVQDGFGIDQVT